MLRLKLFTNNFQPTTINLPNIRKYLFDMAHSFALGTMFLWSCNDIIVIGDAIKAEESQAIAILQRTARRETNKFAWRAWSGFLIPK